MQLYLGTLGTEIGTEADKKGQSCTERNGNGQKWTETDRNRQKLTEIDKTDKNNRNGLTRTEIAKFSQV